MGRDDNGRIAKTNPHPLSSWSVGMGNSYYSETGLGSRGTLQRLPLHKGSEGLVTTLYQYWMDRFSDQSRAKGSGKPYAEPSDHGLFKQMLVENAVGLIPPSRAEARDRVRSRYRVG
jgi:hypothetical protein